MGRVITQLDAGLSLLNHAFLLQWHGGNEIIATFLLWVLWSFHNELTNYRYIA